MPASYYRCGVSFNKEEYKQFCELEDYQPSSNIWAERIHHHTIDPTNEGSIKLICSLIDQYAPLFRSKYFNICCDETFDLGKGRNKDKDHVVSDNKIGVLTQRLYDHLTGIQWAKVEDTKGWCYKVKI